MDNNESIVNSIVEDDKLLKIQPHDEPQSKIEELEKFDDTKI